MSTAAHRNKRPFQPSITSFFARVDRSEHDAASSPTRTDVPHHGLAAVPANVQASLLNVGMRVRKSVPEGYKTHKTHPTATNAGASPYKSQTTFAVPAGPSAAPAAAAAARPTELMPFCGLHKTGGYTVQQQQQQPYTDDAGSTVTHAHPVDAHALGFSPDDFALSSQESNASTLSTDSLPAANANKRRFEEEEEEEDADNDGNTTGGRRLFPALNTSLAVPPSGIDDDLQISPRTTVYPVSHTAMPNLDAPMRPVARPKSRMKNGAGSGAANERRLAVNEDGGLDFGEAEFLKPPEEAHDDGEVEMGGV